MTSWPRQSPMFSTGIMGRRYPPPRRFSIGAMTAPLDWDGERLRILDQTRLPGEEVVLTLTGAQDTADAIRRLAVRGAPPIGVAAAYGLAMAVTREETAEALERAAALLAGARPT